MKQHQFREHQEHKPPWERWHPDRKFSRWSQASRRQRGVFFFRFAGIFALMILLVLGGMAAFAFLLSHLFDGGGRMATIVWLGGCGLSLVLPLLAGAVAMRVFRGIATPLADVMSAADAVAGGDLSVRVPEPNHGPVDFRHLAKSFNRMTEELERSDQQRRNLTADVAHELRTPLHIIQGNLEGILDGVYEPTPEQIDTLLDETHLLTRLVEDLQTLSLAEAGQLTLKLEPVDVAELLTDAGTSFSGQMESAGIDLQIEIEGDAGLMTVTADAERLDQIISNLVANALRHTPPGGRITLGAAPSPNGVRILVGDSGEGISPEDLPFIFDRFWRGDRARARSRSEGGGSGLGLAITRQLVQSHGGRISVASEPGQGTRFTIDLPL
ncbi:MAG: HAMP domain-containing protein [Chloroflexi bacterium]|nr:HAMP domain-containing protein [Chloroflexota bacterium]MBU1661562.1 HAMP domain-containing protein [Chloroflexota bacterium]